jgi:hypothetical protein
MAARRRAGGGVVASGDAPKRPQEAVFSDFPSKRALDFTPTERAFQSQVLAYARLMGWQAFHDNATNAPRRCSGCGQTRSLPRNAAGLPDLILVRRPRVVWAELKAERGKISPPQAAWIAELRACNQEVYIWRPSSWQEIEECLK